MCKKLIVLPLLLAALMFGSCIKEDMTDCPPDEASLRLQFSYTLNKENTEQLQERVHNIKVFVFDQSTKLLMDIIDVNDADIAQGYKDIDLPAGTYTLSAWGGGSTNIYDHGFTAGTLVNSNILKDPDASIPQTVIGVTTLNDFRFMVKGHSLQAEGMDLNSPGEVTPIGIMSGINFDDLFFAMADNVTVVADETQTIPMSLLKDTSVCHVTVTGLNYLYEAAMADMGTRVDGDMDMDSWAPEVCISGANERYGFDNSIDADAREVCFMPPVNSLDSTQMTIDIKVLRLDINRFKNEPVNLNIRVRETDKYIVPPIDVIDNVILKAKDATGALLWPDQDAIDRENDFPITISIQANLSVQISVNGFVIENPTADIGRH